MMLMTDPPDKPFKAGEIVEIGTKFVYDGNDQSFKGRRGRVLSSRVVDGYHKVTVAVFPARGVSMDPKDVAHFVDQVIGIIFVSKCPEIEFHWQSLERVGPLDQLAEL